MKRFKFRLQRVLDFRNSIKKEKELELARRNSELHSANEGLSKILELQEGVLTPEAEVTTMAELSQRGEYLEYLQRSLEAQRLAVLEAAEAVEKARQAYIESAVEAESLETLKKKRIEEHRQEARRHERKETDKLTVQRHRFKAGRPNGSSST